MLYSDQTNLIMCSDRYVYGEKEKSVYFVLHSVIYIKKAKIKNVNIA